MSHYANERKRIRDVYASRDAQGKGELYAWHLPENHLMHYRLQSTLANELSRHGWLDLGSVQCLDVGCGTGKWLRTLMEWGCPAANLHGIDLLPDRIEKACKLSPDMDFQVSDAWPMPFDDHSVDLVTANVVFSSILDDDARSMLAKEMMRVVSSGGADHYL